MKLFWFGNRKKPEVVSAPVSGEDPMKSPEFKRLRKQYAEFCISAVMPFMKAWDEFAPLCSMPEVEKITFTNETDGTPVLVVGTSDVYLRDYDVNMWRHIGKFAIVINRKPSDLSVSYFNLTRQIAVKDSATLYDHPHLYEHDICSSEADLIRQSAATGRILDVVKRSIVALHTYGPNRPYLDLQAWPLASNKLNHHLEETRNA